MADAANQGELISLKALAWAPAVAKSATAHLSLDLVDRDLEAGWQAFHDDHKALTMAFTGGEVAKHSVRLSGSISPNSEFGRGSCTHCCYVRAIAKPTLLLQRRLMDKHAQSVNCRCAGIDCCQHPRCFKRGVHKISDDLPDAQQAGITRHVNGGCIARLNAHTDTRRVHNDVCSTHITDDSDRCYTRQCCSPFSTILGAIQHRDLGSTGAA
jgi:hypothetical protein